MTKEDPPHHAVFGRLGDRAVQGYRRIRSCAARWRQGEPQGWLDHRSFGRIVPRSLSRHMIKPKLRVSSYPLITGDIFRFHADHPLDDLNLPFNPETVKKGDLVFVSSPPQRLREFFTNCHERIQTRYILLTPNDDPPVPGEFGDYLADDKIVAWFAKNPDRFHPKLRPIPMGVFNPVWTRFGYCDPDFVWRAMRSSPPSWDQRIPGKVYVNITVAVNRPGRARIVEYFRNTDFSVFAAKKNPREYLVDLQQHQYVLSPPGNGLDCFRAWKALCLGAIPIVQRSCLDPIYEDLPVILVDDFTQITPDYLQQAATRLRSRPVHRHKLWMDHWLDEMRKIQALQGSF